MRTRTRPRRTAAFLAAALCALCACGEQTVGKIAVLISIDTLRADQLGVYGNGRATSPHLDRFAASATLFTQTHSVSSWTMPAMGTLATGQRPNVHGLQYWHMPLADDIPTLGALLAEKDVESAFFGNPIPRLRGLEQGFSHWETFDGDDRAAVAAARQWLKRLRGRDGFLWLHLLSPHEPYDPVPQLTRPLPGRDPRHDAYEGEVRTVDAWLAPLLREIDPTSLVLITADHGETLQERGDFEFDHGRHLWEELLTIPLLMRTPAATAGCVENPVILPDIPATICDWFGVPIPAPGYGRSLFEILETAPATVVDTTFAFVVGDEPPRHDDRRWAVRAGPRKAIFNLDSEEVLYFDLAADPGETNDLAGQHPQEIETRRRALEQWRKIEPTPRIPFGKRFSREEMERLQSLGYLGGGD